MYKGILLSCIYVYHIHAYYLCKSKEGFESAETGVTDDCEYHVSAGNHVPVSSARVPSALNRGAVSAGSKFPLYSGSQSSAQLHSWQLLSPFCGLPPHLVVSLAVQKLFRLMRSRLSTIGLSSWPKFTPVPCGALPGFSSSRFDVSGFALRFDPSGVSFCAR